MSNKYLAKDGSPKQGEEKKGWTAYFSNEQNYLDFLKWQQEQGGEIDKNFTVRLRAFIDKKLSEFGIKAPSEFFDTIERDEAIQYLKLSPPLSATGQEKMWENIIYTVYAMKGTGYNEITDLLKSKYLLTKKG